MAAFRWVLLLTGLFAIAIVYLYSTNRLPRLRWPFRSRDKDAETDTVEQIPALPESDAAGSALVEQPEPAPGLPLTADSFVITVRIMPAEGREFAAEQLVLALRAAGMRHGKYGIFHRHALQDEARIRFSAASLVEPGSFDLTRLKESTYRGVSLFTVLPATEDNLRLFDDMIATARKVALAVDGRLTDELGSAFSLQRERYMREEVIQFTSRQLRIADGRP